VGLFGWLVAGFVSVGLLASLAVVLVVLPTLESNLRSDRVAAEMATLRAAMGELDSVSVQPTVRELVQYAEGVGRSLRGESRVTYTPDPFSRVTTQWPPPPQALEYLDLYLPNTFQNVPLVSEVPGTRQPVIRAQAPLQEDGGQVVGVVEVAAPVRGLVQEIAEVRRRVILAVIAVLGLACLGGYGLSRLLAQRIGGLAGTAAKLAAGDLTARAPAMDSPAELVTLGSSLNGMATRLESLVAETVSERDRARSLISSLAEGVLAVTPEGDVTVANAAARRLLRLPEGSGPLRLGALPGEVADAVAAAPVGPHADPLSREVRLPEGDVLELQAVALPERAGVVLTLRDVTDERRLERARRDLVANVSHELKTPLAAIRGFIELLEGGVDPERRREFLALMSQEAGRLERLVEEQLELARLDAGAIPLERELVDLGEVAEGLAASRRALAARDGVTLMAVAPPEPIVVDADPDRVDQLLLILLDNALRHTSPGGRVALVADRDGPWGTIAVRDDGEGIPAEAQPFVFDRFYQADSSREGLGAGLGLAIARGLARAHGGGIDLESTPGYGAIFTVRLPLATVSEPEPEPAPAV
jgi:two-component system sensor histidine kinase ResE